MSSSRTTRKNKLYSVSAEKEENVGKKSSAKRLCERSKSPLPMVASLVTNKQNKNSSEQKGNGKRRKINATKKTGPKQAVNNNAQVVDNCQKDEAENTVKEVEQSGQFLADDVQITINNDIGIPDDDGEANEISDEDLDYDEDVILEPNGEELNEFLREDQEIDMNSEVQFNVQSKRKEKLSIDPDDLEDYVKRLVDSRWKAKEQELIEKHSGKDLGNVTVQSSRK